jgi:hypothetical protein
VVLSENQTALEGDRIAHRLMSQLGIAQNQLLDCAYIDLLAKRIPSCPRARAGDYLPKIRSAAFPPQEGHHRRDDKNRRR